MASKTSLNSLTLGHVVHLKGAGHLANLNEKKTQEIASVLKRYNTIVVDGDPFYNNGFTKVLQNTNLRNKQLVWFKFSDPNSTEERLQKLNKYPNHLKKYYVTLNTPNNLEPGQKAWMVLGRRAFNAISREQKGIGRHDVVLVGGGPTLSSELTGYILNSSAKLYPFVVESFKNGIKNPPHWLKILFPDNF